MKRNETSICLIKALKLCNVIILHANTCISHVINIFEKIVFKNLCRHEIALCTQPTQYGCIIFLNLAAIKGHSHDLLSQMFARTFTLVIN